MMTNYTNLMSTQDYVISGIIVCTIVLLAIANFIRVDRKTNK